MTALEPTTIAALERHNYVARSGASSMRGFYAFGCTDNPEDPYVRELTGSEDWPTAELHHGVAGVSVNTYADDTGGAFIQSWGPDRDAVVAAYRRAVAAFDAFARDLWLLGNHDAAPSCGSPGTHPDHTKETDR